MIKGKKVGLVRVRRKDLRQLLSWRNKPEFRKFFREYRELNMSQQEKWYNDKVIKDPSTIMFSVIRLKDKKLLGCAGLVYVSWAYKHADLSLYIGWNDSYIDNRGYAEETAKLLLKHSFLDLGLNKVWTEIYIFDDKKKKLYNKLRFRIDGVLRDNTFYDGNFRDSYILSMLSREWKNDSKK